jgi:hypothetical protein
MPAKERVKESSEAQKLHAPSPCGSNHDPGFRG